MMRRCTLRAVERRTVERRAVERRAVKRVDRCAVPAGGTSHTLCSRTLRPSNGNAAPGVSHTVCRRTLRRRTCGTLRHPQGVVGECVEVGAVDEVLVVEATLLSGGGSG